MKIVPLTDEFEDRFWNHVYDDPLDYYFFIFDWTHKPLQTKIFLSIDECDKIAGLMLLYNGGQVVQLRGSREAVKLLVGKLGSGASEITAPLDSRDDIVALLGPPKLVETVNLLSLKKGQRYFKVTAEVKVLNIGDAEAVADLMRRAYPAHWGEVTAVSLRAMCEETLWLGIKDGGKLVALGVAPQLPPASHIMFIATDAAYRNQGYATSIVSTLVKGILKTAQVASIFVISDNLCAAHVYAKVGFKLYKQYAYIKP
jgi:ribosomal protein S18 acetylase RimI-like enzyme